MFFFKGRKKRIVDSYPEPIYDIIIEPFAGSAAYSCKYWDRKVILIDLDPTIAGIWDYLINIATPEMILKLPIIKYGETIDDKKFNKLLQAEKDLIGFYMGTGNARPNKKIYISKSNVTYNKWDIKSRKNISDNIFKVKHWIIINGDYSIIKNIKATYFIDPPYNSEGGTKYKFNSKSINYDKLSRWVLSRNGQIMACEDSNLKKKYLPFKRLSKKKFKTAGIKSTKELLYYRSK